MVRKCSVGSQYWIAVTLAKWIVVILAKKTYTTSYNTNMSMNHQGFGCGLAQLSPSCFQKWNCRFPDSVILQPLHPGKSPIFMPAYLPSGNLTVCELENGPFIDVLPVQMVIVYGYDSLSEGRLSCIPWTSMLMLDNIYNDRFLSFQAPID